MRVVVTGGTGYLGAAIVRALHARGHQPVIYARRASVAALPGVAIDGDVRDRLSLRRAADEADAIIHTAALVSVWHARPREFDDVNVGGLENVIDTALSARLQRVVYTSSFLALPPGGDTRALEANDYQRTKVRALDVARAAAAQGVPIVTLCPGVVYGPGAATEGNLVGRLVTDHLARRLPGLIGADRPWSYAFVDDVANAHVTALERPDASGEYQVGGENAQQMRVFEIVREFTGCPLPRRIPFAAAWVAGVIEEARAKLSNHRPVLTRGVVDIFRHDWSMNSERSQKELSYHITPLREGLQRLMTAISA